MNAKTLFALSTILVHAILTPLALGYGLEVQAAQGTVTGYVTPNEVNEKEPFTFAAQGSVEGEVVDIKTVEGEVVATKKTDRLGRVFLAAGLAAGTYLLTHRGGGGKPSPTVPIEIKPGNLPLDSNAKLEIPNPAPLSNMKDGLRLSGTGFHPDAGQMAISAGSTDLPVLAATPRELKTGSLSEFGPGSYDLKVTNRATGQTTTCDGMTLYDARSRLTRERVSNNDVTMLEFLLTPDYVRGKVKVRITSGPVHFGGGAQEKEVEVVGGVPKSIPILANATGMGKFTIGWELNGVMLADPAGGQDPKKNPCKATEHQLEAGAWQREQVGRKWVAWRRLLCQIHFGCSKAAGHGGAHDFTKKKRCDEREKFTDANTNGVWDENDGAWTDKNSDGKKDPGEYNDANGDGNYDPPEKFEDKNKNGSFDGDKSETKTFDSKEERDKYIKDHS